MIEQEDMSSTWASFLFFISEIILSYHEAALIGQVLTLPARVIKKVGFEAVCFMPAAVIDARFETYDAVDPKLVIAWVVPIHNSEVEYIERFGWDKFEDLMAEENDLNLFSLQRKELV